MTFEEMWVKADFIDYSIGGMDSIPEWEVYDYVCSLLMANHFEVQEKNKADILERRNNDQDN